MGYYMAGDWYEAAGDPGKKMRLLRKAGKFMPGAGRKGLKLIKGLKGKLKMPGAAGRRHRRINPCNPRALRRALRRAKAFEHFARRVIHITHPPRYARVKFRFPRKRRRS
jgi:hypothetical protein